jgi:nicotinamide riboside kinase
MKTLIIGRQGSGKSVLGRALAEHLTAGGRLVRLLERADPEGASQPGVNYDDEIHVVGLPTDIDIAGYDRVITVCGGPM